MTGLRNDFCRFYRYSLAYRNNLRGDRSDSVAKPLPGGPISKLRSIHALASCQREFPGSDGRNEEVRNFLAFADCYQCIGRKMLFSADKPIERVGIKQNSRQRLSALALQCLRRDWPGKIYGFSDLEVAILQRPSTSHRDEFASLCISDRDGSLLQCLFHGLHIIPFAPEREAAVDCWLINFFFTQTGSARSRAQFELRRRQFVSLQGPAAE